MIAHLRSTMLAAGGALLLASSSNAPGELACTALFAYGVVVDVRDSTSGAPLAGARGAVRDAGYVDSLRAGGSDGASTTLVAAGERAGTYTVDVIRPGYRPFTQSGVVVTRDACHVQPQRVLAALAPDR